MRIIFMGTPEFAVPTLKALVDSNRLPIAVVTRPDRPKGRGQLLTPPPVKVVAESEEIPVRQPKKLKDPAFIDEVKNWAPDLIVVVAFGRIIPDAILEIPRLGSVNIHPSLIPKYRGAGPIAWAIIRGEKETGVTTMKIDSGLDTGDIYLQETIEIQPGDTTGDLSLKLSEVGARLLLRTVDQLEKGSLISVPQDSSQATMAPMLEKEHGEIDWTLTAFEILNLVRGLNPWPGAYSHYNGTRWKLWKVTVIDGDTDQPAGSIIRVGKDELIVAAGEGLLRIDELQAPNARRMAARDFLAGHSVKEGMALERLKNHGKNE